MHNFYIRYNYKNIIPFNLKKKKLRVHANIIGSKTTNLYGFFIGGEIKFWYYYFGINGLKKDSVFLEKKFLNKKLGVFFISNFNMVEGKWLFPKIYEQYYKNYLFLKKKKINLFKTNLVINNNYSILNNIFYLKIVNNLNSINIVQSKYFYNINLNLKFSINSNIFNNLYNLYKYKNYIKLPFFLSNNTNNNNIILDLSNIQENFDKLKKFQWNWNFHLKSKLFKKKKIDPNWIKQKPFWYFQKKSWYFKQQSDLFFKKKWFFMKNKNYLNNFYLKKNIINIIQFIKLNKAINKIYKKNIIFLFYIFYLHFNFIKLYKNIKKKKIKVKKKKLIYYKNIDKKKINNKKNINNNIYDIINIKLQKKKINKIKFLWNKNLNEEHNKKLYIKFFIILKKKIKKFYKFKIINNNFILNNINNNNLCDIYNNNINYYYLYQMWLKYSKIKKKYKLITLYWIKKKNKKKYKKKYNYKNISLLWSYYITKRPTELLKY